MCNPYLNQLRFRISDFAKIPRDAHGVYGIWCGSHCIYVGKAEKQTIAERLRQHWRKTHNLDLRDWIFAEGPNLAVAFFVVTKKEAIDNYERLFIKRFQPITNKVML